MSSFNRSNLKYEVQSKKVSVKFIIITFCHSQFWYSSCKKKNLFFAFVGITLLKILLALWYYTIYTVCHHTHCLILIGTVFRRVSALI